VSARDASAMHAFVQDRVHVRSMSMRLSADKPLRCCMCPKPAPCLRALACDSPWVIIIAAMVTIIAAIPQDGVAVDGPMPTLAVLGTREIHRCRTGRNKATGNPCKVWQH